VTAASRAEQTAMLIALASLPNRMQRYGVSSREMGWRLEAAAMNRLCQQARTHLKSAKRREQLLSVSQIQRTSCDPDAPWWRLVYHQAERQSRVACYMQTCRHTASTT
jgi:hypothetical protein